MRVLVAVLIGTILALTAVPRQSQAKRGPIVTEEDWTDLAKLRMAQAFLGEADGSVPDHEAIAWVLYRRWKIRCRVRGYVPLETFIQWYSSPLKLSVKTKRARGIRTLVWGDPLPGMPYSRPHHVKRWKNARKLVDDWQAGRVKDPCPKALHWGGTMDKPAGHWYPVSCGRTRNIFYGIKTRQAPKS